MGDFAGLPPHLDSPAGAARPLGIEQAWSVVRGWLERANVSCPGPTERHQALLGDLLVRGRAGGNHTSDAHLAALAIEWGRSSAAPTGTSPATPACGGEIRCPGSATVGGVGAAGSRGGA